MSWVAVAGSCRNIFENNKLRRVYQLELRCYVYFVLKRRANVRKAERYIRARNYSIFIRPLLKRERIFFLFFPSPRRKLRRIIVGRENCFFL